MFSYLWHTIFFDPIYNLLIFFVGVFPDGDVGLAIIAAVVVVKTILLPLSIKAAKTQRIMKEIDPKLREIKEQHKDNREEQAKAMMAVYKEAGLNPFSSIFLILLQIPIVIALYFAVVRGGGVPLPDINVDLLYSFVTAPATVTMNFLGVFDITERSLVLAAAAGISQFIQMWLTLPAPKPKEEGAAPNFKDDFARTMHLQMRYVMPLIIFGVGYSISASIALYFLVSSVIAILQEYVVRKHR